MDNPEAKEALEVTPIDDVDLESNVKTMKPASFDPFSSTSSRSQNWPQKFASQTYVLFMKNLKLSLRNTR
jgi:hypothetical protein